MSTPERGQAAAGSATREHPPRLPDFFIAGHPKSGTTALYEALRRHPEIFMPDCKEPWFFAAELHVRTPPRPEGTPESLEQYCELFARAASGQAAGEATAHYLWSKTAAAAIAEVQPAAKVIAVLREPASFLHSLHLQFLQNYVETETDLRRALALEPARREGREIPRYTYWPTALLYSEHVRYAEQLRRYEAVLPAEQLLVLVYDDFQRAPREFLRTVLRFIGVDEQVELETAHANPTVRARSQRLHEAVHAVGVGRGPASRAVKAAIKTVTPGGLRRRALYETQRRLVFSSPEPPDERLMAELRERFRPEVEAISAHLGRDLVAEWGYERAG